jgi:hypothetical protein
MRYKFPTIVMMAMLGLAGCDKVERADQSQMPTEQPAVAPAPAPAVVAPEPPTPPAPKIAPEGEFYVTQRVEIITDSGVFGVKPGTKVKLVRKEGATMIVTDGKQEFKLQPEVLTNDLDVAAQIAPVRS